MWQDERNGRRKLVLVNPTHVPGPREEMADFLWRTNRPAIECVFKLAFSGLSRQCMDANEPCAPPVLRQQCAAPRSTNHALPPDS